MMENEAILSQILALKEMEIDELLVKYAQVFDGEKPSGNNAGYLRKKIAYRLQEMAHGGLSEAARTRLEQLINVYDPINNRQAQSQPIWLSSKKRIKYCMKFVYSNPFPSIRYPDLDVLFNSRITIFKAFSD